MPICTVRKGRGAMVREWRFANVLAVRFRSPLGAGFSEKYNFHPLSILGHCLDVVFFGKALYPHMFHFTQVEINTQ